jgi:DNA repair protein SbcC/Rad50
MKLSGFLNKPRWQSKETAVRRAGVAEDDDAELLASLASIARTDADPGVRSTALKRLAEPALAQRIAQEDADASVRADARRLWFDLLAGTHAHAPTPPECERLLRAQDDAALIEHIARTATDASLRASALARVMRASLLAERATTDPAPELRIAALERIDDEALLERLAERTRKTDKRVSRRARERADALRIARGDSNVVENLARGLCERLERLVREPQAAEAAAEIDTQWTAVEARASEHLRARYRTAHALLAASREGPVAPVAAEAVVIVATTPAENAEADTIAVAEPAADAIDESPAETPPESAEAEPVSADARSDASINAANAGKAHELAQREANALRAEAAVAAFESAINEGIVAQAHAAHAALVALRKSSEAAFTRALQRRVAEAERRYAQLSQWQHWSDNQRRRQLCESIEELSGSGLHPDAIATRVREAQAEWSKLDAAEGHAVGAHGDHGWARRFHAACRRALEPARSYFKKRQELRKAHAQAVTASLDAVRAIPDDSTDWALIAKTRHAVVDALRSLDRIDPHERKTLAKNLKAALTALDARLEARHAEVQRQKAALIAEAEAFGAGELPRNAAASARALQQRWRDAGNGRRDRDQAQWKAFRAALDAMFGKLDAERAQRNTRDADARTRADALCAELEGIAGADAAPQRAVVTRIEGEFDALRVREEPVLRRFRAAQSALRDAGMRRERSVRRNPYETWLARYALCCGVERGEQSADEAKASWDAAPRGDIASSALATRFEAALQRDGETLPDASAEAALREVLIRIEIFAGLESPVEDRERRRALQIERLSARMRGGAAMTPHQELADLLSRWTALPLASAVLDARLRDDLAAAIETLP